MSEPLDRLSGLAPQVDHARARAYFDRHRSRARRRRRIAAGAAVVAVVVAGSVAALAGIGTNDSTDVSTADGTELNGTAHTPPPAPTVVVLSEGTGTSQYTVANTLSECGFEVMVEAADLPATPEPISVASTEPYRTLATTAATIVGTTEVSTISGATRREWDIVVTVGDDYRSDSIDTTPCPVASLFEPGGPPMPGTPPLLSIDVERVEGPNSTAAIYGTHVVDPDTPVGMCVSFSLGGMSCGGDTDPLPGLVGGTFGGEADLVAFIGPASAERIEVDHENGTSSAPAHSIPAGIDIEGTVAVLDLSDATRIVEARALDANGQVIARNASQQYFEGTNRSLSHRAGPVDTSTAPESNDVASFCAMAPESSEEVPESYVGSGEHVIDLRSLLANAPEELYDELERLIEHFDQVVDPADPDSQLVENFPGDVTAAVTAVTGFIDENCTK